MGHHRPPTPDSNQLQQLRFEDLRKHDALQQSIYAPDPAAYHMSPQADSDYCSPSLVQQSFTPLSMRPYDEQTYGFAHSPQYQTAENVGLGFHIPYGNSSLLQPQCYSVDQGGSDYHEAAHHSPKMGQGKVPLTPKSPDCDVAKPNRSNGKSSAGISPKTSTSRSRPVRAAKSRNSASNKSAATRTKLDKPLSELTAHMTDVPLRDIEAWVNRSADERHKEVEKRNGSVPRPMNSFMLYRSAYAERTKRWCVQNNHQVVSSVSGESWPLEPKEVRNKYNEYAALERLHHARAHPTYKFSPSKAQSSAKRRKDDSSSDDEDSNLWQRATADSDAEWRPNGSRKSKSRSSRRRIQDYSESSFSSPQNYFEDHRPWAQGASAPMSATAWPAAGSAGRMMSMSMGTAAVEPHQPYMTPAYAPASMLSPVSASRGGPGDAYEQPMPAGIPGSYQPEVYSQTHTPLAAYQDHADLSMRYYEAQPPEFFSPGAMYNDRAPSMFSPGAYDYAPVATQFDWADY